jgi:hypothetical protein
VTNCAGRDRPWRSASPPQDAIQAWSIAYCIDAGLALAISTSATRALRLWPAVQSAPRWRAGQRAAAWCEPAVGHRALARAVFVRNEADERWRKSVSDAWPASVEPATVPNRASRRSRLLAWSVADCHGSQRPARRERSKPDRRIPPTTKPEHAHAPSATAVEKVERVPGQRARCWSAMMPRRSTPRL